VSTTPERPFPLVPRRRYVGVRFGQHRSPRRGQGDEVAGTRPYRSGDRPTWIDWRASARLTAAHGADEFVVREFFADTAPRVAIAVDRRPRMSLYGPPFPWLDKRFVIEQAVASIVRATVAEGGDLAYVEQRAHRPLWLPPGPPSRVLQALSTHETPAQGSPAGGLEGCLDLLGRHASSFPPGTFVFVLSDFVEAAPSRAWVRLRALRWDVVPIVVQDPTWEQSFPAVGGVLLPVRDPSTGEVREVVLGRGEARARAAANEQRLEGILARFTRIGFDPVVLGSSDPDLIRAGFARWADRRRRLRRRSA
jgi:uncharacterized protein (DUF58 family)